MQAPQRNLDDDDEAGDISESEVDALFLDDDGNVDEQCFEPEDREVESEDDSWFDQLVSTGMSSSDLGDSQPPTDSQPPMVDLDDPVPAAQTFNPVMDKELVSAHFDTQLDYLFQPGGPTPSMEDSPPADKKGQEISAREVARPLNNPNVISIEDSPTVKKETGGETRVRDDPSSGTDREKEIANLNKRLQALEECIKKAESGAQVEHSATHVYIMCTCISMCFTCIYVFFICVVVVEIQLYIYAFFLIDELAAG